jgi:membrane peptidoglycan carboxypeptidase
LNLKVSEPGNSSPELKTQGFSCRFFIKKKSILARLFFLALTCACIAVGVWEGKNCRLQATFFARIAGRLTYPVNTGKSSSIHFPVHGPYDLRLGYVRIPEWIRKMTTDGYAVTDQAVWSPYLLKCTDLGLFPVYPEKMQTGMLIHDCRDQEIISNKFPRRLYGKFDEIPPLLVQMLLYIENRYLLDDSTLYRNPAIEWKRQGKALMDMAINLVDNTHKVVGGSTLATQIEKFRHSPEGRTTNAFEKIRQIVTASLRAYRTGEQTTEARRQIVLKYINSIPLAAAPGYGEVIGLGDGLWAWYGMDFQTVNRVLREIDNHGQNGAKNRQNGEVLKAALSIFLAQRRPSSYLLDNREALGNLTDSYLRIMADDGLISHAIRDAALMAMPPFLNSTVNARPPPAYQQKAANLIRSRLLAKLGIGGFYELDRVDATIKTTIDLGLQKKITERLAGLRDLDIVKQSGFLAPYLLKHGDPAQVVYSFCLYEKAPASNMLRIQTNTFDGPFNIDEQTKLDLGSTAKLRTLIHYLEIIKSLHDSFAEMKNSDIAAFAAKNKLDPLTRWSLEYLKRHPKRDLKAMLNAAMERRYSASPGQRFFTGGGLHTFSNFNRKYDHRVLSVRDAFKSSINLVFIRMMRNIVYYHIFQRYGTTPKNLEKIDEVEKKRLLSLFADKEGSFFIRQFYKKYRQKTPAEAAISLFDEVRQNPAHLTAVFRFLTPDAPVNVFADFLKKRLPDSKLTESLIYKLYGDYTPGRFSLADIGYISNVHPLDLWLVRYLQKNPVKSLGRDIRRIISSSQDVRQEVYQWLFKTRSPRKQFQRMRTILEIEAFLDIHRAWKRLGYPFDSLVPSYATAIGSAADRPASLAELSGIILNNGVRNPMVRIKSLHFAVDTPYETRLDRVDTAGEQVLGKEVAKVIKEAMLTVVSQGTARRTITAYVNGKNAGDYTFSSSLPVQVLKQMLPDIAPLLENRKGVQKGTPGKNRAGTCSVPAKTTR